MNEVIARLMLAMVAWLVGLSAQAEPMRTEANSPVVKDIAIETEFVVCGGGLAGVCAAVSAARHGSKVVLVQDRPVLGGNASSEMRMGICGAHGDQNYEAGILEEMQLENLYRNPLQRYTLWDDVIYSTVIREKNITLLLNTSVNDVVMDGRPNCRSEGVERERLHALSDSRQVVRGLYGRRHSAAFGREISSRA